VKRSSFALAVLGCVLTAALRGQAQGAPLIIPTPKSVHMAGPMLRLDARSRLVIGTQATARERMAVQVVQNELRSAFGLAVPIVRDKQAHNGGTTIVFGVAGRTRNGASSVVPQSVHAPRKAEGYCVRVGRRGAIVAGRDAQGVLYGAQTVCQLLRRDAHGAALLPAQVDDYPTLGWRGAHLFVGNRALPFHARLIARIFARLKFNNLVLECEQAKWNALGRAAPPWAMSKADLVREIGFARAYGLSVTPLINSVGHMGWLFADKANLPLAEDPQTPYAAYVANPAADRALFRLYDEVLTTFHAPALHIGGDEVTLRGRFPWRSRARYPTVADAYVAHVRRLHDYLQKKHVRTWLWADMLLAPGETQDFCNAPSLAQAHQMRAMLPRDLVLFDWHYAVHGDFSSPRRLQKAGFKTVIGAAWNNPANIAVFSKALAAQRERGLLQTTWAGYNSRAQNLTHDAAQFSAFVVAAEEAWNGGRTDAAHLPFDPARVFRAWYGPPPGSRKPVGRAPEMTNVLFAGALPRRSFGVLGVFPAHANDGRNCSVVGRR